MIPISQVNLLDDKNPNVNNTSLQFKNKFSESYEEPLMNVKNTYDTGQQHREYYSTSEMKPAHKAAPSSGSNPLGA